MLIRAIVASSHFWKHSSAASKGMLEWIARIPRLVRKTNVNSYTEKMFAQISDASLEDGVGKTLTIFTPTYNRGYIIGNLYQSLLAQTNSDFCWMIVDDGSTDNTRLLVDKFISEGRLEITYIWQENGGKQRAHNTGVNHCQSELFFCVDSDDTLVPTAVEDVLELWSRRRDEPSIAGIIAMRGRNQTEPMGTWFPEKLETTTIWNLNYKLHHRGDTALIYRTDILREFPYVVAPDEKFIGEGYVYHKIDQHYQLAVLHKIIWICEYLPDGYTAHVRQITRENPKGYMRLKRDYIDYADTFLLKVKESALYLVGAHFANCFWRAYRELPNRLSATFAVPLALALVKTVYRDRVS